MKGGEVHGYTIVETMIFLAVSGMLFLSATLLISGKQRQAEFTQAVRDFESSMSDLANDISTGHYTNKGNFRCQSGTTDAEELALSTITPGTPNLGNNTGCILIGQVVLFAPNGNSDQYQIIPVAGKQRVLNGTLVEEVQNLKQAKPTALLTASIDQTETVRLTNGLRVRWVRYGSPETNVGAAGFFTTFGAYNGGKLLSGTPQVDMYALGTANQSPASLATTIHDDPATPSGGYVGTLTAAASSGVKVCLDNGSGQRAVVTLGGNGRAYTSKIDFASGNCS